MANLAVTYMSQSRWPEAELLNKQVMEARKTKLGADHPDTLRSMKNLAFTWKGMGCHKEALGLMQTCYTLQQRILGPNHQRTQSTVHTLITWLQETESDLRG
jgi:hypothetical protein